MMPSFWNRNWDDEEKSFCISCNINILLLTLTQPLLKFPKNPAQCMASSCVSSHHRCCSLILITRNSCKALMPSWIDWLSLRNELLLLLFPGKHVCPRISMTHEGQADEETTQNPCVCLYAYSLSLFHMNGCSNRKPVEPIPPFPLSLIVSSPGFVPVLDLRPVWFDFPNSFPTRFPLRHSFSPLKMWIHFSWFTHSHRTLTWWCIMPTRTKQ